jgi:hypothetical protein
LEISIEDPADPAARELPVALLHEHIRSDAEFEASPANLRADDVRPALEADASG